MVITPNSVDNSLALSYDEEEEFDAFILVKHEAAFVKLSPLDHITITTHGFVPLEVSSYICEVSKHCAGIILQIHDDKSTYDYIVDIIRKNNLKNIYHNFIEGEK